MVIHPAKQVLIPANEKERLEKLWSYNLQDKYIKSGSFAHVVGMAAHIFQVPIAVVNFVGSDKVLINSGIGVDAPGEVDREISLCSLAILQNEVTVFANAKEEACLLENPVVHGKLGLGFYAGAPLLTPEGFRIGAVAVADVKPRMFSKADKSTLENLAKIVMEELEALKGKL